MTHMLTGGSCKSVAGTVICQSNGRQMLTQGFAALNKKNKNKCMEWNVKHVYTCGNDPAEFPCATSGHPRCCGDDGGVKHLEFQNNV